MLNILAIVLALQMLLALHTLLKRGIGAAPEPEIEKSFKERRKDDTILAFWSAIMGTTLLFWGLHGLLY